MSFESPNKKEDNSNIDDSSHLSTLIKANELPLGKTSFLMSRASVDQTPAELDSITPVKPMWKSDANRVIINSLFKTPFSMVAKSNQETLSKRTQNDKE